jgi:cytoskeletal protein RodZ
METKFQTSFIPKKPTASAIGGLSPAPHHPSHSVSIFLTIGMLLFVASLVGAGGVYAYQQYLQSTLSSYKQDLATRQQQFNLDLITELKAESVKIDTARQVLNNHLALSQIFSIIGQLTIQNVRFTSMDVTVPSSGDVKISLQGQGTNLSAVAFQSDVLGSLDQYGLRNIVKNPILSNPSLDGTGMVGFTLAATIDPKTLSYEKSIAASVSGSSPSAPSGAAASTSGTNGSSASSPFTQ